jgi:hypothetical protein
MNYGLPPRPSLPPEEMAALMAAAEELLKSERPRVKDTKPPTWRFSGRWFNAGPYANRRPHVLN